MARCVSALVHLLNGLSLNRVLACPQLIGSLASVFVSTGVYCLYRRVYEFPSTAFPVPTAAIWLNLARLVNTGKLPPHTEGAMLFFGTAFVALAALKAVGKAKIAAAAADGAGMLSDGDRARAWRWTRWIPSGYVISCVCVQLLSGR